MKVYKLTDQNHETHNSTKWGPGVTHTIPEKQRSLLPRLCSADVIHAYTNPDLALFVNPIHGCFDKPVLWEAEAPKIVADDGTKIGVFELTTLRIIKRKVTTDDRVAFAIFCALEVCEIDAFREWAERWLDGSDSGYAAAYAAYAAAYADDHAAYAAYAAYAADHAAYAAAHAAAYAARAAHAAAYAARAADRAADLNAGAIKTALRKWRKWRREEAKRNREAW